MILVVSPTLNGRNVNRNTPAAKFASSPDYAAPIARPTAAAPARPLTSSKCRTHAGTRHHASGTTCALNESAFRNVARVSMRARHFAGSRGQRGLEIP
jgi:hypothetical protein